MRGQLTDAALASLGGKTTLAGAATSGAGWMVSNSLMSWVGVAVALAGFAMSFYYRRKEDQRREREHQAFMRRFLENEGSDA